MTDEEDEHPPVLPDLGSLLSQFEQASERIESAAAEASRTVVEGRAAGGAVTIQMSGDFDALSVRIDPEILAEGDVSLLEDLVLAALRDALGQVAELQAKVADAAAAPSVDLSSLTGFLGGLASGAGSSAGGVLGNLSEVLGGLGLGAGGSGRERDDAAGQGDDENGDGDRPGTASPA